MRLLSLRTVIAATDLTPASDAALETALRLAAGAGTALHVVHIAPSADLAADKAKRDEYTHDLEEAIRRSGVATDQHTIHILSGHAPSAITALAERVGADLIIVGRHRGDAQERHGALGSTAYEIVTHTSVPCLVITRTRSLSMHCVLAATDFSESARGALLMALSWASALRSRASDAPEPEVLALHVAADGGGTERTLHTLDHELDLLRQSAGDWAGVRVRGATQRGPDPVSGIVDYSRHHDVSLVVLGTRGLAVGATPRLGSVSAAATQQMEVPVLLVPPAVWRNFARDLDAP